MKCTKGQSCGKACISKNRICKKTLSGSVSSALTLKASAKKATPKAVTLSQFETSAKNLEKDFYDKRSKLKKHDLAVKKEIRELRNEVLKDLNWSIIYSVYNSEPSVNDYSEAGGFILKNLDKYHPVGTPLHNKLKPERDRLLELEDSRNKIDARIKAVEKENYDSILEEFGRLSASDQDKWLNSKIFSRWGSAPNQATKVSKLKRAGLSTEEASAVAAWIHPTDFSVLNKSIYDPDSVNPLERLYVDRANELIRQAVKKLPKSNRDDMRKLHTSRRRFEDPDKVTYAKGSFRRGLNIPTESIEGFISQYKNAIGKTISEKTHFAATSRKNHGFLKTSNVIFNIKAKDDGTGSSVALDYYKNLAYEGEVFWAAGQNFLVKGVKEKKNGKYEIVLQEP